MSTGVGQQHDCKNSCQNVLDDLGIDYDVETSGVGSIVGQNYDLIITVEELKDSLSSADPNKIIFIKNFFKADEIEEKLKEKLTEMNLI